MYFVYMIKNPAGKLYVGLSVNSEKRLTTHNQHQGAKFTKTKTNFYLVFKEEHFSLSSARKREIQIKKWRRDKKETLIERYRKNLPTN